jgi:hypothetical protein
LVGYPITKHSRKKRDDPVFPPVCGPPARRPKVTQPGTLTLGGQLSIVIFACRYFIKTGFRCVTHFSTTSTIMAAWSSLAIHFLFGISMT